MSMLLEPQETASLRDSDALQSFSAMAAAPASVAAEPPAPPGSPSSGIPSGSDAVVHTEPDERPLALSVVLYGVAPAALQRTSLAPGGACLAASLARMA